MIQFDDPDERAAAVGEYVLGTLDAQDHPDFDGAQAADRSLLADVYAWQDRLLGLTAMAASVAPAPDLWHRIDLAIGPTSPPIRQVPTRNVQSWWQQIRLWQGIGAIGLAASILLAILLVARIGVPESSGPRYLAVLQSPENQTTGWLVELQKNRNLRLVPVGQSAPVPAGRALQFWTKPQGASGPTSLGLVQPGHALELPVSRLPAVEAQQLFEITLEPAGGSTIGRPTGPILYVGRTVEL
ncbi:MAG: anti-sigma factor [Casimicrobiaceae bacterium]